MDIKVKKRYAREGIDNIRGSAILIVLYILIFVISICLSGIFERFNYLYYRCFPEKYEVIVGTITNIEHQRGGKMPSAYDDRIVVTIYLHGIEKTHEFIRRYKDEIGDYTLVAVNEGGHAEYVRPNCQSIIFSEIACYAFGCFFLISAIKMFKGEGVYRERIRKDIPKEKSRPKDESGLHNELMRVMPKTSYSKYDGDTKMLDREFLYELEMKAPGPLKFVITQLELLTLLEMGFLFAKEQGTYQFINATKEFWETQKLREYLVIAKANSYNVLYRVEDAMIVLFDNYNERLQPTNQNIYEYILNRDRQTRKISSQVEEGNASEKSN